MQKTSFLLIIGIFLVVLAGAYSGYQFWQKSVTEADLKKVEKSLEDYNKRLLQFENQQVVQAVAAKKTVKDIKVGMIKWSEVVKKISATVPKKSAKPLVNVLSYSGSSNSDITMNVKTNPGSDGVYADVADLIEAFDDSENFSDAFVASISAGQDDEGREVLTFSLSVKYLNDSTVRR